MVIYIDIRMVIMVIYIYMGKHVENSTGFPVLPTSLAAPRSHRPSFFLDSRCAEVNSIC